MTAHYLAVSTFPLMPNHITLVHAAAGGVGQLLIQIAKKRGAKVIATVSTQDKADTAIELGADHAILYTKKDFEMEVMRITNNMGVDVVYDGVGKDTFLKGLNCLKPRGMMVLFGQASGPVEPVDPQILNKKGSLYLTRPTINHYIQTRGELLQRSDDLFTWLASGELVLWIDKKFKLKDAIEAHKYMEGRKSKGKVLLLP
jgi:NADPH2:quinone reductase